ncbi:hypothetical protein V7S43_013460 [Phytophthora oleae]|uniref:Uncharacterized protein n=1 Tax=Phytophthora oleae TaxID=2107226 RepID=A0ABD3F6V6_9STRA
MAKAIGSSSTTTTAVVTSAKTSKKKTKTARKKLKAPDSDAEEKSTSKAEWTSSKLETAYQRVSLEDFLRENPVMRIPQPQLLQSLTGPGIVHDQSGLRLKPPASAEGSWLHSWSV